MSPTPGAGNFTLRAFGAAVLPRLVAPLTAAMVLLFFSLLYIADHDSYMSALTAIGFNPLQAVTLDQLPFGDGQYILAGVECTQRGFDIYVENPCDLFGRPNAYSPLWMHMWFLPTGQAAVIPAGLELAALFILSLAVLPPPRRLIEIPVVMLTTFSTSVCYAVERANIDLVMFLLAIAAGLLLRAEGHRRFLAYGCIVLAGLLKFYPVVLLALSLRERPKTFVIVNLLAGAVMVLTILGFWQQFREMLPNVPFAFAPRDTFGAAVFPSILACAATQSDCFVLPPNAPAAMRAIYWGIWLVGVAGVALSAHGLLRMKWLRESLALLNTGEEMFLVIGALLLVGCFFAGISFAYREIYFLLTVPGLLALLRTHPREWLPYAALGVTVFLMWNGALHNLLDRIGVAPTQLLTFRELGAWWIVSVFIAILWDRLSRAPVAEWLRQLCSRGRRDYSIAE